MSKRYNLISILIFLIGTTITYVSYYEFYQLDKNRINNLFNNEINEISTSFNLELENYLEGLYVVQDLLSEFDPPYSSFEKVIKEIINRHHEIQYVTWIPKIKREQLAAFKKKAQRQIYDFRIKEPTKSKERRINKKNYIYYPVYYIYPSKPYKQLRGLNLYPNDSTFYQMVNTKDNAKFHAFKQFNSTRKKLEEGQYILFVPVYSDKKFGNIKGYLSAVIDISQLFTISMENNNPQNFNITITDISNKNDQTILYKSGNINRPIKKQKNYYVEKELINLEGRKIKIEAYPSMEYLSSVRNLSPYYIFIINILTTLTLVILIRKIMLRTVLIEEQKDDLAYANRQLEVLSNTDALTGLANRRHFETVLDQEWKRSQRESTPLTVIMIDIDHFKKYNDTYGHVSGDKCLRLVAQTLAKVISRPTDLVSRYGGEEFVIILSNTEDKEGKVAARCVKEINLLNIPHKSSPVANNVTISAGSATYAIAPQNLEPKTIVRKADKALYAAKNDGRNRVKVLY